jgi:hypothetical protein
VWAQESVWTQRLQEYPLPPPGIKPRSSGRPARSQTLYCLSYPAPRVIYYSFQNFALNASGFLTKQSLPGPKSHHTTVKYTQPFSKHTSGVYTQRCPTQDSFYMTSYGNLPTRTHILAVSKSPNTGALSGHKLTSLQSGSFQTHVFLSQFPNTNSVFQPTAVSSQTHTQVYTRRFPNTD